MKRGKNSNKDPFFESPTKKFGLVMWYAPELISYKNCIICIQFGLREKFKVIFVFLLETKSC